jgi:hypothetical protein
MSSDLHTSLISGSDRSRSSSRSACTPSPLWDYRRLGETIVARLTGTPRAGRAVELEATLTILLAQIAATEGVGADELDREYYELSARSRSVM